MLGLYDLPTIARLHEGTDHAAAVEHYTGLSRQQQRADRRSKALRFIRKHNGVALSAFAVIVAAYFVVRFL